MNSLKINWRNLNNGVMIFWEKVEAAVKYEIEFSVVLEDKKISILIDTIDAVKSYYSFVNIGNGEYVVSVKALDDKNNIICDGIKKSNFISVGNYLNELMINVREMKKIMSNLESGITIDSIEYYKLDAVLDGLCKKFDL